MMHQSNRRATAGARKFLVGLVASCGVVAMATPATAVQANSGSYHAVASLTDDDGEEYLSPLVQGADGLMYGVAQFGGAENNGTVFKIEADGTVTVVHSFDGSDGSFPDAPLTLASDGWLYGSTAFGGADSMGVIFKVSSAGDFVVLHVFSKGADQGLERPNTQLIPDGQGGFYCTGDLIAKPKAGVLFQYSASGAVTILAQFQGNHLGRGPNNLVMGSGGVLYGTTMHGVERNSSGTFFSYKPGGRLKTLHFFDFNTEGTNPATPLVVSPGGDIYGMMRSGNIFRMSTKGVYSPVHTFDTSDPLGFEPAGGLTIDASGKLYGTTSVGGKLKGGTVFSMTLDGQGKVLKSLGSANAANGYDALSAPTWVTGGALWGTTTMGGQFDKGTVYRIDLAQ